ncbi:MAG: exodeoxyribonuclease VII large subunit [Planctomycetes bacterium]|nr:exodeoxyribonuclease VII large subunit [Planctomycetota bacterium]
MNPQTVSELTLAIKSNLETEFGAVWVAGEVSNVSRPPSGHVYFALKDSQASCPAVLWRSSAIRHKFDLKDGMEVIVRGRLTVYPPHGKYQLDAEKVEPKGIGAQELALRQLKEKLLTKGYFDPRRKKALPLFPKRIALVTSPSGAAVRDMLQVLTTRWPLGEIIICPVRVQGEGAAIEIAAMIRLLNRFQADESLKTDIVIVGRGGGSSEDLWCFNEEIIADAIFESKIPIVSAVGHEIDTSISDLVADLHALTPTDAANKIVPDRTEMLQSLRDLRNQIEGAVQNRLEFARHRLDALAGRGTFRRPLTRVRELEERLDELAIRLNRAARRRVDRAGEVLVAVSGRLETLSPLNVLRRGYSLTRTESSTELVRNASSLQPGDRLLTKVASGTILSRVEEIRPDGS